MPVPHDFLWFQNGERRFLPSGSAGHMVWHHKSLVCEFRGTNLCYALELHNFQMENGGFFRLVRLGTCKNVSATGELIPSRYEVSRHVMHWVFHVCEFRGTNLYYAFDLRNFREPMANFPESVTVNISSLLLAALQSLRSDSPLQRYVTQWGLPLFYSSNKIISNAVLRCF
ncbi:hypothetical protein FHG87_010128 [Trinorchestia longiramus]|nr:hypothetical protein FHG87_010128 [Trinorchestia longiramus]